MLTLILLCGSGCANSRTATPFELEPVRQEKTTSPALPDEMEQGSSQLAALVLADQHDAAAETLGLLERAEDKRAQRGAPPSGLIDNAREMVNTLGGPAGYASRGDRLLDDDATDDRVRRRIERHQASHPLAVAQARIREDRLRKLGSVVNRLTTPLSQFALGDGFGAVESGRAAVGALLVMHSIPTATVQERQALRAYEDFLNRNPCLLYTSPSPRD